MTEPINVELSVPSLSDYVGVARLTASGVANRMKFTHEDIEDIKIAVSEACTNAVQYAYGDNIGNITLTFSIFETHLEIKVSDQGLGFNIEDKPDSASDPEKIGLGLGIVFMKSLMDTVDYQSSEGKGTVVTMTKKVPPARTSL